MGDLKIRKVRSDKKRDIKPTVPADLKICIERLSSITNTPVQHLIENICKRGVRSHNVLEELTPYFQRTIRFQNTLYIGGLDRPIINRKDTGQTGRVYSRFSQTTFDNITNLAFALGVTPSRATAILLKTTIKNTDFMNNYVRHYLKTKLDPERMKELKEVLRYINSNNSEDEQFSWFVFLSSVIEDIKDTTSSAKDSILEYLDKWKSL